MFFSRPMRFLGLAVAASIFLSVSQLGATNASEKIAQLLAAAHAKGEFSGAVLVTQGERVLYEGAMGEADRSWKIANDFKTTRYRICSITKQFTALLVLQQVETGKLKLDGKISDYLPQFRAETGTKITVRDLLQSASGLPQLPEEFYVSEDPKMTDALYVLQKYLQGDLVATPGEEFNYNNADYLVLGAILEAVTGRGYAANLQEKILQPLGMTQSGLLQNETVVPHLAEGYTYKDGDYRNEGFVQIQNFGAAGAMYSTVGDLLRWDQALMSHRLLSQKLTEEMFAPSAKLGFVALGSWTYEAELADGESHRLTERQGAINGFSALNLFSPKDKVAVIFLGNVETQTLFRTYAKQGLSFEVLNAVFAEN